MRRREFIGGAAALLAAGCETQAPGLKSVDATTALGSSKAWFKEAKFGMMVHFGLYSILGGEWKGKSPKHLYGEWIQHASQIPLDEYSALTRIFNPMYFDAKEWISRARDAGMKYFVITSKHHDGFALFRSRVSKYNVVDATPFKRDIIEEVAEACRETGVKLGLYYSQDLDWSDPNGGGRRVLCDWPDGGRRPWGNHWDWPDDSAYDFNRYLHEKSMPQIGEILTQYGDLCLLWFDMPMTLTKPQSQEIVSLVRRLQPGCLVSGRIGHDLGDYFTPGDNEVPSAAKGEKAYEVIGTMNDSWGYRPTDTHYRTIKDILAIKAKCNAMGANYLLNVGPDPLGRFPAAAINILQALGNGGSYSRAQALSS